MQLLVMQGLRSKVEPMRSIIKSEMKNRGGILLRKEEKK